MTSLDIEDLRQKKTMRDMADDIEEYVHQLNEYAIIDGLSKREYKKAMDTVQELIDNLRKGKADKVYRSNLEEVIAKINKDTDDGYPF